MLVITQTPQASLEDAFNNKRCAFNGGSRVLLFDFKARLLSYALREAHVKPVASLTPHTKTSSIKLLSSTRLDW